MEIIKENNLSFFKLKKKNYEKLNNVRRRKKRWEHQKIQNLIQLSVKM